MRSGFTLFLVLAACLLGSYVSTRAASPLVWVDQTMETPGGTVRIEGVTDRSTTQPRPVVLILCGTKGFFRPAYREIAQALATAGMDAYLVHYLSETDLRQIVRAGNAPARIRYYATRRASWIATVRGVASTLSHDPLHNNSKIGLLGVSLGAQLASAVSANQHQFAAVVLVDGGFPDGDHTPVTSMPPLQLIWGEADQAFPIAGARQLDARMKKLGGPVRLNTYPGMSHGFILADKGPETMAARGVAVDFLRAQLAQ